MKRQTRVNTVVRVGGELEYSDLVALVRKAVPDAPADAKIEMSIYVPGGGDWSNTDLDVEEHSIEFVVTWSKEEVI